MHTHTKHIAASVCAFQCCWTLQSVEACRCDLVSYSLHLRLYISFFFFCAFNSFTVVGHQFVVVSFTYHHPIGFLKLFMAFTNLFITLFYTLSPSCIFTYASTSVSVYILAYFLANFNHFHLTFCQLFE